MSEGTPERPVVAGDFRIGDWLVQPGLDRLSIGDTITHLRPQLTDLLVVLARHAGQPVSKETLLQEVWATQFVGESALTRCIAELRQALGDDARAPKLLETIPKRGYRVVAPVEFLKPGGDLPAQNGNGQATAGSPAAGVEADVAPAGVPQPVSVDRTAAAPFGNGSGSGERARWCSGKIRRILAQTTAVAGAAIVFGAGDFSGPRALAGRDTVLLADVANTTGDSLFDDTLRLALAANLEQAPFLRVVTRDEVRRALVLMGRSPDERMDRPLALDVCRREGAAVILAGSIAPVGSRYAVGVEAVKCRNGESLGHSLSEAENKDGVLAALEQSATQLRRKLGESRASWRQNGASLVRATTPSLEALEALSIGDENRDHARVGDALTLYRQATDLDPGFALAWARRGAAAITLDLREEATQSIRRAYELRDRVSQAERFYIEAHYYRLLEGDPEKAIEVYRAWKRMYPGSVVPPANLASILAGTMGQYCAAIPEARSALELAPRSSIAYYSLVVAYLGSGRIPEARRALAEAARLGIDDRLIHRASLRLAVFDKDAVAVEREAEWAAADPATALSSLMVQAAVATTRGRLRDARQLWSKAEAKAAETGSVPRVAEARLGRAEAEALLGDARTARALADSALGVDARTDTLVGAAIVFCLAGKPARGREILDSLAHRSVAGDQLAPQVWLPVARGLVEAGVGNPRKALEILQSVVPFERGSEFGLVPLGVRALVLRKAGQARDAADAFGELIGLRAIDAASPWIVFAELGLARALKEAGDYTRSMAAYDAFLASWKDADADTPLLERARRERAAIASR